MYYSIYLSIYLSSIYLSISLSIPFYLSICHSLINSQPPKMRNTVKSFSDASGKGAQRGAEQEFEIAKKKILTHQ